jgi:hypothetical protein
MLCSREIEFGVNLANTLSNELKPGNHEVVRDDAMLGNVTSLVTCLVSSHHTSLTTCQYQCAKVSTFKSTASLGQSASSRPLSEFLLLGGLQSKPTAAGWWSYSNELVTTPPTA